MANRKRNYENTMRVRAALFIIVFLLMVAVIISLLNGMGISLGSNDNAASEPSAAPTSVLTMPPVETQQIIRTEPPVSTPEPTPTPTPTPTPESTPVFEIVGEVIGSGSIRSNTGVGLNLVADWTAISAANGMAEISVTVSLEHYGIGSISQPVIISVGAQSATEYAQAINYDGTQGLKRNELASHTFSVDLPAGSSGSFTISASWMFNGTYSGKEFTTIDCADTVLLERIN